MHIDVCNGDADGLCSVVQWRLHKPQAAQLITGLKRDIELLERVQAGRGDKLPDAPWSRRVAGSFVNVLAAAHPQHAHTLLTATAVGDFVASVRAPLNAPVGAAGIDYLPAHQLERFIETFSVAPWGALPGAPHHS